MDLYRQLSTIRRFEETVLEKFATGVFSGTTHTCLGQEANAVGVLSHLQPGDIVFSNHRCHGHFLAYGGEMRALFAELMGRQSGVCGGRGGSQHLQWRDFYSNGIQGGIVPVATGMAMAEKRKQSGALTFCFLGDGTLGQGVVYEALNMAALWKLPILYVVEDNQIAQTTPTEQVLAGDMAARFEAFGIPVVELDTSDVVEIHKTAGDLVADLRRKSHPQALILHTCRFGPHSKGDDTRPPGLVTRLRETRDPLLIHAARLQLEEVEAVEAEVNEKVESSFQAALHDPLPTLAGVSTPLRGDAPPNRPASLSLDQPSSSPTVLKSLNAALHQAVQSDAQVLILGEDILDPYGGAFQVTRGLSSRHPGQVIPTPISEAGIVGVAAGMALRGLRPVVEIMFGDFVTLIADQVINHLAKFRWMYNDQVRVPLVIRTPMGGRRGYGPTHSQTLEKLFLGIPGLKVIAPCALESASGPAGRLFNAGSLLWDAIFDDEPVVFVENKLLYRTPLQGEDSNFQVQLSLPPTGAGMTYAPAYQVTVRGAPPASLTLVSYGYMAELARQAMYTLAYEHEIFVELIVLTQLAPPELNPVFASLRQTSRLLTIEEGTLTMGWGAEVVARAAERLGGQLRAASRVAALDLPIPASGALEGKILPAVGDIIQTAQKMV